MPVSPNAEAPLAQAWTVALRHAQLNDDHFYLLACAGAVVEGHPKAASYEPGLEIEEDDLVTGDILAEANEDEHRVLYRIAVFEDVDFDDPFKVAILTATLRHEIEHARQRMRCGGVLFAVDQYADDAIRLKAGGLPGSNVLYNFKPTEQDANAAAAMLLRRDFASEVRDVLESRDGVLARSWAPPGRLETLLPRTVCFIYLFSELVEEASRQHNEVPFDRRLDRVSKDAGDLWRHLIEQRQSIPGRPSGASAA
jgi:hypothetical protein